MSDNRPPRYEEVGADGETRVVYRASSLGMCERAYIAAARGYEARPHPQWFQAVLDEGNVAEEQIIGMYERYAGVAVDGQQQEVEFYVGEVEGREVWIRGHVDGSREGDGGRVLVECKKFRDSTWGKFRSSGVECNVNYPWQVSVYMLAGGFVECDFIGGHWSVDGDGNGGVTEVEVKKLLSPPIPRAAIVKKIARVERMIVQGFDVGDAGVQCEERTYPCAYWYLHSGADQPKAEAVEVAVSNDAIADWHESRGQLASLRAQVKALEARQKAAAAVIVKELQAAGVVAGGGDVTSGVWRIKWSEVTRKEHVVKASTYTKLDVVIPDEGDGTATGDDMTRTDD